MCAASLALWQADDLRFEVAGCGRCLDELTRQAAELNVAGRVRFLGEVRDIPSLLSHASMFVLPSLSEGIPLTVLEAMARGLPVVATRVGGVPEVIIHGQTGLLVPPTDPVALAQAIVALWRDPAQSCYGSSWTKKGRGNVRYPPHGPRLRGLVSGSQAAGKADLESTVMVKTGRLRCRRDSPA